MIGTTKKMRKNAKQDCAIEGCNWPHAARGWCKHHYHRWKRHGHPLTDPPVPPMTDADRSVYEAEQIIKHRASVLRSHGISQEIFEAMMQAQHGVCAICGSPPTKSFRFLDIDHDKTTGRVRALLCRRCNTGLGYIEAGFHLRALEYLGRFD